MRNRSRSSFGGAFINLSVNLSRPRFDLTGKSLSGEAADRVGSEMFSLALFAQVASPPRLGSVCLMIANAKLEHINVKTKSQRAKTHLQDLRRPEPARKRS
ncbi:MAG: hypothetical protein C5B49_10075 [Bdellovibrio sp.]|nr:MAG: hypothetical protein C5B49_10075 [Bdellovibrio sp.]